MKKHCYAVNEKTFIAIKITASTLSSLNVFENISLPYKMMSISNY